LESRRPSSGGGLFTFGHVELTFLRQAPRRAHARSNRSFRVGFAALSQLYELLDLSIDYCRIKSGNNVSERLNHWGKGRNR
jgi:hypothetical protein